MFDGDLSALPKRLFFIVVTEVTNTLVDRRAWRPGVFVGRMDSRWAGETLGPGCCEHFLTYEAAASVLDKYNLRFSGIEFDVVGFVKEGK